jgi:AMP nucleosidase
MAVDMECATLFSVGFYNHIPVGALLLVSDKPMIPEGVKTKASDDQVTKKYAGFHVEMGVKSLQKIIYGSNTLKHLKIDL